MEYYYSKISLLRELCKKLGIKLYLNDQKDFILDNEEGKLNLKLEKQFGLQQNHHGKGQ